mmetsp:Transcript_32952/g.40760  ORF Transcript_32952/g.40760 Transcript_32952/m.40760 type:complete len:156 (+) Transcript_32952:1742-2209(+)
MLMIQAATAMGYALSSAFNHETTAVAFAPIVNMPLNLLGGFMINLANIWDQSPQRYIAWLMYISPVRYGFSGMMAVQFPVEKSDGEDYEATVKVMEKYGFEDTSYGVCVAALFVLFVVFRSLVVLSLWCQDSKKSSGMTDTRNTNIPKRKQVNQP